MLPQEQRHRCRADRSGDGSAGVARTARHGESPPRNAAGETEHVEELRIVIDGAGAEQVGFPGSRRGLERFELLDDREQSLEALHARGGFELLPAEEEAGKISR
jgi:hypothetical protein